jgi:hypothetical protein
MQVIFVPMEPAVLHGLSHGPKLKTIKRRREFTPRRNKLVHEVACWPRPRPWPAISRGAGAVSAARSRGCRSPSACGRDTTARFGSRSEMGIRGRGEPRVQSSARLTATPCSSSTFQAAFASRAPNGLRSSANAALRRRSAAHTPAAGTCHDGGCGVARTWSSKRTTAAMAASPAFLVGS